jgi:dienelactone hydrolase
MGNFQRELAMQNWESTAENAPMRGKFNRRNCLHRMAAGAIGASLLNCTETSDAADVEWLSRVRQPPVVVPRDNTGYLEPLLIDADGQPIQTLSAWKKQRSELRNRWLKFLGPMPEQRPPVELKVLREDRIDGCVRLLVRYESEAGLPVEGYLLRPAKPLNADRCPAIVALHQTTRDSIEQIAGVTGPEDQQLGLKLCRRGFIVFCPRCFLWQDVKKYTEAVERFRARHPKTLGMHKMLYDAIRSVDVLASLDVVDTQRIGAVGHSLGAKETLYLAAFDERIRAAVASEGGTGFKSTNWDAPWYLGKQINEPNFKLNHHQLLALIAPRPFLIVAGEQGRGSADGARSWPYLQAAEPVWKLHGKPIRLGLYNHGEGHSVSPKTYRHLEEWLVTYLVG